MRIIERKIAGAFIFSKDNRILLGYNRKGGTYPGQLVVPAGGIEDGESEFEAATREVFEETGIDITSSIVTKIDGTATGESEKTLDSGETVLVKMHFYDFEVHLHENAESVVLRFDDDFKDGSWFTADELANSNIGKVAKNTLKKLRFL